ncbi:uncharacterized protein [Argopecten irradians]|uniref:uncharacterized protein isoform X2 n=1 Tax=Argopecten irradians TaxID=31199 RepID=UPI00371A1117
MALLFLCLSLSLFCTLNASVLRTKFHNNGLTRDAASDYCARTYYQGYLAPWQEIENTRLGSLQIWDGNSYQLSPPITILGCTNDTGSSQHTIPAGIHWSKAAAHLSGDVPYNRICHQTGTYVPASWEEAAYDCTSANSFPRPVPDICIPGTAGSTEWYGGFRLLQYIPGSTDGTFCKRLSYSTQYAAPTFKEVSCDSTFRFYCSYTESGYNEPCEATIASSCDVNFVCSDRTGTPKCRCTEDKYWDDTYRICRTRKVYANRCDTSIPDVCADGLSCQSSGGSYTCHCKEDRYLDKKARTAKQENHMMKVVMPAYRMCVNAAFLVRLQMRIPNVVVVRAWSGTQPVEVAKHGGPTTKAVLTVYRGFV